MATETLYLRVDPALVARINEFATAHRMTRQEACISLMLASLAHGDAVAAKRGKGRKVRR